MIFSLLEYQETYRTVRRFKVGQFSEEVTKGNGGNYRFVCLEPGTGKVTGQLIAQPCPALSKGVPWGLGGCISGGRGHTAQLSRQVEMFCGRSLSHSADLYTFSEHLRSPKSNLSMTYPRVCVLNNAPRPPNCMPMPGPHSWYQWIRQGWTAWVGPAQCVLHSPCPDPTISDLAGPGTLQRHTISWVL